MWGGFSPQLLGKQFFFFFLELMFNGAQIIKITSVRAKVSFCTELNFVKYIQHVPMEKDRFCGNLGKRENCIFIFTGCFCVYIYFDINNFFFSINK